MTALLLIAQLVVGDFGPQTPVADSYRTEVIFLTELPAERALTLHERLIGQAGESAIVLGRQPNVVVVKDTPERLARFRTLLDAFDRPGAAQSHIYLRPVRHMTPSALAALAAEVLTGPNAERVRMVPDDRGQQLVVMCPPPIYQSLDRLFRRLDVPAKGQRRDLRVTPAPDDSNGVLPP